MKLVFNKLLNQDGKKKNIRYIYIYRIKEGLIRIQIVIVIEKRPKRP